MKEKTIEILKYDLNRNKIREEKWELNKEFVYEIEFLPVLTKRDKMECCKRLLIVIQDYCTRVRKENEIYEKIK